MAVELHIMKMQDIFGTTDYTLAEDLAVATTAMAINTELDSVK